MKIISLTKGYKAIVDDDDYQELSRYSWYASGTPLCIYAARRKTISKGVHRIVYMHREIAQTPKGFYTDHKNGDKLDNRRVNLRICTKSENSLGIQRRMGGSSKFRGVSWNCEKKKWEAYSGVAGKRVRAGYFKNEMEAAMARDRLAKEINETYLDLNLKA